MKRLLIAVGILLAVYLSYRAYRFFNLDKHLNEKIIKGAVILDVRTKWEFEQGHLKDAINIPLSHLHKGEIPFDTTQTIITCCSHGLRSIKAAKLLQQRGYKNACNGGAWEDLGEIINTTH